MLCTECGTYAANKVLRKLGVYAEPAKVYTFDGKITDEDETNGNLANINGAPYWKFGVGSFDLNNIVKAEFCAQGTTVELVEFIVTTDENGVQTAVANIDGMELPAVVAFDGCLYGFCEGNAAYIAKISFAETIHPIDPKYLPGVCLPVVDINIVSASVSEGYFVFDTESCDNLTSAWQKQMPIVMRVSYLGAPSEVFIASIRVDDSIPIYHGYMQGGARVEIKYQPGIEASDWFIHMIM